MFKKIVLIGLLLSSLKSFSQQIYIGQDANEVTQLVSSEVQSNQNAQGYNQVTMQLEPHYNNGILDELLLCKQNVPMIDLHRTADFCTHYIIDNNRLSSIIVEYSNVSLQELEGVMDSGMRKIGDYYFDNSNQYVYFRLMKTGGVVKVYRSLSANPPPPNILKQLGDRKGEVRTETNQPPVQLEQNKIQKYTTNYMVTFPEEYVKINHSGKGEPMALNIEFYDPLKNTDPDDTLGYIDITGFKNQLTPKEYSLEFENKLVDSTGTFYSYKIKDDFNHSTFSVFKLNKFDKVDNYFYDMMFTIKIKEGEYILYVNSSQSVKNVPNPLNLPNPRKVLSRKSYILKTKYSKEQIFNYYKQIGASSQGDKNSLSMPLVEGGEGSCILIQFKKVGILNTIEISLNCDL